MADTDFELHFLRPNHGTQIVRIVTTGPEEALRHARFIVGNQAIEIRQAGRLIAQVGRSCVEACRDMFGASVAAIDSV